MSGSVYDGRIAPHGCAGCTSSVSAAEVQPTHGALALAVAQTADACSEPDPHRARLPVHQRAVHRADRRRVRRADLRPRRARAPAPGEPHEADDGGGRDSTSAGHRQMITSHVDGAKLYDDTGSTIMGLKPGMELSLLDLLYGLLLPSGNDAAIAIAEGHRRHAGAVRRADEREGGVARAERHALHQPARAVRGRALLERVRHGDARPIRHAERHAAPDRLDRCRGSRSGTGRPSGTATGCSPTTRAPTA